MLKTYRFENNHLIADEISFASSEDICWIDLLNPSKEEDEATEKFLGINIPTRSDLHEIELSNRLYLENGAIYSVASIVANIDAKNPEIHSVSFIIKDNKLVTLRYVDPYPYRNFLINSNHYGIEKNNPNLCIFLGLVEAVTNRIADVLEKTGHHLDDVNKKLFKSKLKSQKKNGKAAKKLPDKNKKSVNLERVLKKIGSEGDLISKTRESLISINRLMSFCSQQEIFKNQKNITNRIETISKDISALADHASFLNNKVNFLLDTTLGLINIEQNSIIKIFSVASVVFLPPTLIASVYGMNFRNMPELEFKFGYEIALLLIFLSALIPLKFFKRKGWI